MMRQDTADPHAKSHAGEHGSFEIFWAERGDWLDYHKNGDGRPDKGHPNPYGWFIGVPDYEGEAYGPYETSQAAFCDAKEAIDKLVETGQ